MPASSVARDGGGCKVAAAAFLDDDPSVFFFLPNKRNKNGLRLEEDLSGLTTVAAVVAFEAAGASTGRCRRAGGANKAAAAADGGALGDKEPSSFAVAVPVIDPTGESSSNNDAAGETGDVRDP